MTFLDGVERGRLASMADWETRPTAELEGGWRLLGRSWEIVTERKWVNRDPVDADGEVCVVTALAAARDEHPGCEVGSVVAKDVLREVCLDRDGLIPMVWNDEPGRTRRQVLVRLRAAQRRIRWVLAARRKEAV